MNNTLGGHLVRYEDITIETKIRIYHKKVDESYFNSAYIYWCSIMGLEETLTIIKSDMHYPNHSEWPSMSGPPRRANHDGSGKPPVEALHGR